MLSLTQRRPFNHAAGKKPEQGKSQQQFKILAQYVFEASGLAGSVIGTEPFDMGTGTLCSQEPERKCHDGPCKKGASPECRKGIPRRRPEHKKPPLLEKRPPLTICST
ncbi:hypothetical protein [Bradyrhizobium daqingense]|uniref:hypothetical protein n=1 Tax=Bradyrhizobium daqingense TaxID=993502 RepID=UPI00142EF68F